MGCYFKDFIDSFDGEDEGMDGKGRVKKFYFSKSKGLFFLFFKPKVILESENRLFLGKKKKHDDP